MLAVNANVVGNVQDLVAGQIPAGIGSNGAMMQHVKAGTLRLIAVSGPARLSSAPEVPPYVEQGLKGYGVSGYVAMMAPMGTSRDVITRYHPAISQVVNSAAFAAKLGELGVIPTSSTPEELSTRIRDTSAAFASMVERSGYKMP